MKRRMRKKKGRWRWDYILVIRIFWNSKISFSDVYFPLQPLPTPTMPRFSPPIPTASAPSCNSELSAASPSSMEDKQQAALTEGSKLAGNRLGRVYFSVFYLKCVIWGVSLCVCCTTRGRNQQPQLCWALQHSTETSRCNTYTYLLENKSLPQNWAHIFLNIWRGWKHKPRQGILRGRKRQRKGKSLEVRAGTLIIGIIIISMEMKKDKIEVHVQQREVAKKRLKVNCI